MTRTYTLDADLCDRWATESIEAHGFVRTDVALRDAIRAQQPKPRIVWRRGVKVRELATNLIFTCCRLVYDDKPRLMAWGVVFEEWGGFEPATASFDPTKWEVAE